MRQLKLQVLDDESIQELAAGHRLQLVIGNKPVAEIVATDQNAMLVQQQQREDQRRIAREELFALMEKGFDLGGLRIENRDELYDRD